MEGKGWRRSGKGGIVGGEVGGAGESFWSGESGGKGRDRMKW